MTSLMNARRRFWRYVAAVLMGSLSVLVIHFPEIYWPRHWLAVYGSLIVVAMWAFWLDWKEGAFRVKLSAIPAIIREQGSLPFTGMRPIPVAASLLFFLATWRMSGTLP